MIDIPHNLNTVAERIRLAEQQFGRQANSVTLLAVSKTCTFDKVLAAAAAGQRCFGENYLQEAIEKITRSNDPSLQWHFIGSIQSNKTQLIAQHFDWVHSVDRLKIARRLSEQRPTSLPPLNICLQINISAEDSKSGTSRENIIALAHDIAKLPQLRLRGLMAIPAAAENIEQQRAIFRQVGAIQKQLNTEGLKLDTLSMGMTNDLEAAIAEGATIVRIGTAIFGPRN